MRGIRHRSLCPTTISTGELSEGRTASPRRGPLPHKTHSRVARFIWLDQVVGECRHVLRRLARDWSFSLLAIVILGTALGANAALFAFLSGYLLKPLPIARAEDHVEILARQTTGRLRSSWQLEDVDRVRAAAAGVLEHVYGVAERRAVTFPLDSNEGVTVFGAVVTNEYFTLLAPRLASGRIPWIQPGGGDGPPAVVLSDAGWRRLAAARSDVIGQRLRIDGAFFEVAGVMAPDVTGLEPITPDFWLPAGTYERLVATSERRPALSYLTGGLVRADVAPETANRVLTGALDSLQPLDAAAPRATGIVLLSRPTLMREREELAPLAVLLLAAFALMTLVACANLSGMYLARAAGRTRELALRFALGASRVRVIRPLLIESVALASLGGLLGSLVAYSTVTVLHGHVFALVTASGLTVPPVGVDWRVLLYLMGIALLVGTACTLAPALTALGLRPEAHTALGGGLLRGDGRPHRTLNFLVVAQAAISVALLVAAGMTATNAARAEDAETGYSLAPLVDLNFERPTPAFIDTLLRDPRVESVTTLGRTPLAGPLARIGVTADGRRQRLGWNVVDHRFFDVTGIPIRRGRAFAPDDAGQGACRAIVSEAASASLWPGQDALGRLIDVDEPRAGETVPERCEVIGVASDALNGFFFEGRTAPMVYLTAGVASPITNETIVRWRGNSATAIQALGAACRAYDPASMCRPMPMQALLDRQQMPFAIAAQVASGLGLVTLALACLGLYGLVSFSVVQRTRDIGVRIALGASRRGVLVEVLSGAGRRMALGAALGLPVCAALLALLESQVSVFETFNLGVFVLAPATLVAAGVVAVLVPARSAASVDPAVALRRD